VEPARVPSEPHSPKHGRLILMGSLAGLGLGFLLAFISEQLDTTFGDVEDFQRFINIPVLAMIPSITSSRLGRSRYGRKKERNRALRLATSQGVPTPCQPNIVTLRDPFSVASEQYRLLAMKVKDHMDQNQSQVLLMTSAAGGEGKTTTAVNLSVALSELVDGPVLLVDVDLRKPTVHQYLSLTPRKQLCDLLRRPDDNIWDYTETVKKLHVIAAQRGGSDPLVTLSSGGTAQLVDRLRGEFRYVVLDAPPLVPLADSHVLAGLADAIALVVRAGHTRRELLQRALESLEADGLIGAVLNDFQYQRSRYAYAYRYYQDHYQPQSVQGGGK